MVPLIMSERERNARKSLFCPACGEEKGLGTVVCWDCFKYRKDVTPLKYSGLSFEDWLDSLKLSASGDPLHSVYKGRVVSK